MFLPREGRPDGTGWPVRLVLMLHRWRRATAHAAEAAEAARAPASSPLPSSAPRSAAATSAAASASDTPLSSPADGVRKRLSIRSATLSAKIDVAADSADDVDVAALGASLGAGAAAVLAPALRLRAAEEADSAEAAPQSGADGDSAPAAAPQPLAARVAAAAPLLARHTGAVLAQHGLLPPTPRCVEDATPSAGTAEPAVPPSPPACGASLGDADGRRFVAAFCAAFEAQALPCLEAGRAASLTTQLALKWPRGATSVGGLDGATVAQLMAMASGGASEPMPQQRLQAINALAAVHGNAIAEAALRANVAKLDEMVHANERRDRKDAAAEAAAEVAALRAHAADALTLALLVASTALAWAGWRAARAVPRAVRACFVAAGWHRRVTVSRTLTPRPPPQLTTIATPLFYCPPLGFDKPPWD